MSRFTAIVLVLFVSLFAVVPANAQPITGSWKTTMVTNGPFRASGPPAGAVDAILFGTLPTPGSVISHVAQRSSFVSSPGTHTLPLPMYSDGSQADPSETLWTAEVFLTGRNLVGGLDALEATIVYSGGATFSVSIGLPADINLLCFSTSGVPVLLTVPGVCINITAVAIRTTAPVATEQSTWGKVKELYQDE